MWESGKLPAGKIIMPGVITHSTDVVEHPAGRPTHRALRQLVGKENVIASADCGFGGRWHPQIAWAKLKALGDGARLPAKNSDMSDRHCEERSDEAIQSSDALDCFASLAMTIEHETAGCLYRSE